MKKIIVIIAACILSLNTWAQNAKPENPDSKIKGNNERYCAKLLDGNMVVMHDNTKLAADTTLSNGVVIKTTGIVIKTDGTKVTLNNEECVDHLGNMINARVEKKTPEHEMHDK